MVGTFSSVPWRDALQATSQGLLRDWSMAPPSFPGFSQFKRSHPRFSLPTLGSLLLGLAYPASDLSAAKLGGWVNFEQIASNFVQHPLLLEKKKKQQQQQQETIFSACLLNPWRRCIFRRMATINVLFLSYFKHLNTELSTARTQPPGHPITITTPPIPSVAQTSSVSFTIGFQSFVSLFPLPRHFLLPVEIFPFNYTQLLTRLSENWFMCRPHAF